METLLPQAAGLRASGRPSQALRALGESPPQLLIRFHSSTSQDFRCLRQTIAHHPRGKSLEIEQSADAKPPKHSAPQQRFGSHPPLPANTPSWGCGVGDNFSKPLGTLFTPREEGKRENFSPSTLEFEDVRIKGTHV